MQLYTPGSVLAGRYQIVQKLGQGGMGSVWQALHLGLNTPVAIKLIDPAIAHDPGHLARFKREAQAAATLRSPHVVQILDYGVDLGTPFIVMELLDGETLADRLSRLGRLSPQNTATLLVQVARALSRAHELGIVHRDLKPDNLFVVNDGDQELVKVLDFGIAKRHSELAAAADVSTRTGAILGTPYYMSPEQGYGRKSIDYRTDIWALAVIAFECMTGRRPFNSDNVGSLLVSICTEPAPIPSQVAPVPPGFDEWFARGVEKAPEARFQSAKEAAAELSRIAGAGQVQSGSSLEPPRMLERGGDTLSATGATGSWTSAVTRTWQRSAAIGASILAVALLVGIGIALALRWGERPEFASGGGDVSESSDDAPSPAESARQDRDESFPGRPEPPPTAKSAGATSHQPASSTTPTGRSPRSGRRPSRGSQRGPATGSPPADPSPKSTASTGPSRLDTDPGF